MKIKATNKLKICTRCVMDNSDSEIFFNKLGICNHCIEAEHRLNKIPKNKKAPKP